jgi:hypothetical protein
VPRTSFCFFLPKILLFRDVTVGPPRSQARRNLFVRHFPSTALHKTTVAGWRRGAVGFGDEDSWRWRKLLRLLRVHLEEEISYSPGSGYPASYVSCF